MSPRDLSDFFHELSVMHYLPRYAHIVSLLGVVIDEAAHVYLMVLEWMQGGSLYEFLRAARDQPEPLSIRRQMQLALMCTKAVAHLHALKPPHGPVLHRDIKSLNFLLDEHGDVRVCE